MLVLHGFYLKTCGTLKRHKCKNEMMAFSMQSDRIIEHI